jgi:hypothetical protein
MESFRIIDHVDGTATNADGHALFLVLDRHIQRREPVVLSFAEMRPMSSSFLNSSFGEIVRKYGFGVMKRYLRLTEYRRADLKRLREYFQLLQTEAV